MKKIAALILALILILSFAACGNEKTEPAPAQDNRKAYENVELSLGDTLPNITLWGTYYAYQVSEEESAAGLAAGFYTENSDQPHVFISQWDMQGKSLEEFAAEKFSEDDSKMATAKCSKFSSWQREDDYDYYYYVTYSKFNENNYIVQNYFFEEEGQCVKLSYFNKLQAVEAGSATLQLPVHLIEAEYEVKPENLVGVYYDKDSKFPMVFISCEKADGREREDVVAQFDERYGLDYSELFNMSADGKTVPMGLMKFTEANGDSTLQETEYFAMEGSDILYIDFVTDSESGEFAEMAIPALLDAVEF